MKAYMYTRVSTAMQTEGYSLEAQAQKIRDFAKYKEIRIIGEYCDAGISGKNISARESFRQMLTDIAEKQDHVDYVLVFKLSRFGRNAADTLESVQYMQDYGVNLISVDDNLDSSGPAGKLIISIMAAVAEMERENINAQTMAGRRQKARSGGWNGGFAPYGYTLKDGKLVVVEEEAQAVREIYRMYIESPYGVATIAKRINELYPKKARQNGYLTRFSADLIKDILDNPVYAGKIAFGRRTTEKINGKRNDFHVVRNKDESSIIISDGTHQALVSEKDWALAQEKRRDGSKKRTKPLDPNHAYILSGLLRCPECGAQMYGITNGKKYRKDGTPYPISYSYKCRSLTRETGHTCNSHLQYSAKKLDNAVRDIVVKMVSVENFESFLDSLIGKNPGEEEIKTQIALEEKELRRLHLLRDRIENQMNLIDYSETNAPAIEESLDRRLSDVLQAIAASEDRRARLDLRMATVIGDMAARDSVYAFLKHFEDVYDRLSDAEKKTVMQSFIDRIELYPKENLSGQWIKSIHFRFPLVYDGKIVDELFFQPKKGTDETVVLMSRDKE